MFYLCSLIGCVFIKVGVVVEIINASKEVEENFLTRWEMGIIHIENIILQRKNENKITCLHIT